MVIYDSYFIGFREIPNEISLAFTIKGCVNNCKGCHSPYLRETDGEKLDFYTFTNILKQYKDSITCVLFLGGDRYIDELINYAHLINDYHLKSAMYTGKDILDTTIAKHFDYYKYGSYQERFGSLDCKTTNQILLKNTDNGFENITSLFWKEII